MFYLFLQILVLFDALDTVDVKKIVEYVKKLQQPDGSFFGDKWGKVNKPYSYIYDYIIFV
jgi:geranylgeranyl transferase type-2 subunit beta